MNFKNNICTTKEQSERLLFLGLKPETADMSIPVNDNPNRYSSASPYHDRNGCWKNHGHVIPAWSLPRLLEIMPGYMMIDGYEHQLQIMPPVVGYYCNEGDMDYYYNKTCIFDNCIDAIEAAIRFGQFNKGFLKGEKI